MKAYLVDVLTLGAFVKHPTVGHKNYRNAGYKPDMRQCIWVADGDVPMQAEGVTEVPWDEAKALLDQWEAERAAQP